MPGWLASRWYDLATSVTLTALTVGFGYRFSGNALVPRTGPLLIIANHQSFFDPVLVGLAVHRPIVAVARKTLFRNPAFAAVIRSVGAIPLDQEGVGKEGLKAVLELLRQGRAVLIFPEGSRTRDGRLHPFKPGVHLLLSRSRAPVLPVGIGGGFQAWPIWRPLPTLDPLFLPAAGRGVAVAIGRPLDGGRYADLPREQALAELHRELAKVVDRAERLRRKS